MHDIKLKIYYDVSTASLECYAERDDFDFKVVYSNVKVDSSCPSDLNVYIDDFLEELEKNLNKHIEIFYKV